jgi:hypothetical protein
MDKGGVFMYCSKCGSPVAGKFCSSCGAPVEDGANDNTMELNGVRINVVKLMAECGINKQIIFTKKIVTITGAKLKDCVSFASSVYKNEDIIAKARAYQASAESQKVLAKEKLKEAGVFYCPKCSSTNINVSKKGYGYGKGLVGTLLVGPLGLLAGGMGAKKLKATCLNCGYEFSIKK